MKEKFFNAAFLEAKKAYAEDEVPVGCVIVQDEKIISRSHNKKEKKNCAIFHAEIECISKATKKLKTWNLKDCDMYVTLEPCMMCMGAIVNSRIKNLYFACKDPKGGAVVSNIKFKKIKNLNHYPNIEYGFMEKECSEILKHFFKNKRKYPRK